MTEHGSYSTYTNHRCRCDLCRAANVEYQRGVRARRHAKLLSGEIVRAHGVYSTYSNYSCRCDECRSANSRREQALKARKAAA